MSDTLRLVPRIRKMMDGYSEEEKELAISNIETEMWRLIAQGKNDQEIFKWLGFEYQEDWNWIADIRFQFETEYTETTNKNNSELETKILRLIELGCGDEEIISLLGLTDKKDKELVIINRQKIESSENNNEDV